jgi:glycosyltransferase involved in cell wall biosynthesis
MYTANCGHAFECEKWKTGCGKCPRFKEETLSLFLDSTALSFKKMKKAFEDFENVTIVSVSPWLMERAKQSPILSDKNHTVVLNGLDTNVFKIYDTSDLREKHQIAENEKVVFHATSGFSIDRSHIKGGYYILELAKVLPKVRFIVAGTTGDGINAPSNVVFLGNVSNQQELARYYSMADLTVIASKKETFSMILAESMACGTPVAGFYAGGPESITIEEYSSFVEYGNFEALKNATIELLNKDLGKEEISSKANKKYSKYRMANEYLDLYRG